MAAARNLARGAAGVRLFEIGRTYGHAADGSSAEEPVLGLVLAGESRPRGWSTGKAASFDPFDAKAEVLALLAQAGAPIDKLQVMGEAGPQFHPGQSATLRLGPKTVLARFGTLHPAILHAFNVSVPAVAAELYLDALPARKVTGGFARPAFTPPPLQAIVRDFAFLVPVEVAAGDLLRVVRGADKTSIVQARIFDDFRGHGVPEGHKSVAIEVVLQPVGESYTEQTLAAIASKVVAAAGKLGATLRG